MPGVSPEEQEAPARTVASERLHALYPHSKCLRGAMQTRGWRNDSEQRRLPSTHPRLKCPFCTRDFLGGQDSGPEALRFPPLASAPGEKEGSVACTLYP